MSQADIQTLPWPEIVRLVGEIKKHNPVTSLSNGQARALADMVGDDANKGQAKKLDAHDVAKCVVLSLFLCLFRHCTGLTHSQPHLEARELPYRIIQQRPA
jgi:hypothetical protein